LRASRGIGSLPQELRGNHVADLFHEFYGVFELASVELDEELLVLVVGTLVTLCICGPKTVQVGQYVICCI